MANQAGGSESYSDPTIELINKVTRTMGVEVGAAALSGTPIEHIDSVHGPTAEEAADATMTPSEELDEEERRRWLPGQLREAIRYLHGELADKEDIFALLSPRQSEVARWLIETDFSVTEIGEKIHLAQATVSKRATFAVANIIQRAKPEHLPEHLPEPGGSIIPETREATVGGILNTMRRSLEIHLRSLADELDMSISALNRFFNSHSYSNASKVLNPVMEVLGVPPKQAEVLRQWYREERAEHNRNIKTAA